MPTYKIGNLGSVFDDKTGLLLFTGNGVINPATGCLVMGAGFARQVRDRFAGIDYELGQAIIARGGFRSGSVFTYHLAEHRHWTERLIGAFQVKYHWRWPASLELISASVARLKIWCDIHPGVEAHMNYPGIGLGGLKPEQIEPLLAILPERVHVWRFETEREVVADG